MAKINSNSVLKIPSHILFREIDGEAVILNPGTGVYYGLDPVGTRIWRLMQQHKSLSKVYAHLIDEYEVDESLCKKDVLKLADNLLKNGLIESTTD